MCHYRLTWAATRVVTRYEPTEHEQALARKARLPENCTEAEKTLKRWIGKRRLGVYIVSERPLFGYRGDFVSPLIGLVIETDGRIRDRAYDASRDLLLSEAGYTVVRYRNQRVLSRCRHVVKDLRAIVAELRALHDV